MNAPTPHSLLSSFDMLYAGHCKVGTWWNYNDLVSPFFRLYLITSGQCSVTLNKREKYELKAGDMFLVPKFVLVDYHCPDQMEHYYVCLTDNKDGIDSVINPLSLHKTIRATDLDRLLLQRLVDICPDAALPSVEPADYDNNRDIWEKPSRNYDINITYEIKGVLMQLFSRFVTEESMISYNKQDILCSRIAFALGHINRNLHRKISVKKLADIVCISPDHFTKSFKKIMGMSPNEYIILKKVNRAKDLLQSTNLSIKEIAEQVGVEYGSQFTKLFVQKTGMSPTSFRSTDAAT